MKRRAFVVSALAVSSARAQDKVWTIGILTSGDGNALETQLRAALGALGYREGRNVRFVTRKGADAGTLRRHADELVQAKVDVIVTRLTPALQAAKEATSTIPIVMTATGAPVETGIIASLARPGGNITGMSLGGVQVTGKRLQLVRDTLPVLRRLVVVSRTSDLFTPHFVHHLTEAGRALGIATQAVTIDRIEELDAAYAATVSERPDAMQMLANLPAGPVVALASKHRVPLFSTQRNAVEAGALMSYSGRLEEQYRGAAIYIDRIFKGAAARDLPAQEPSRFEMVINLKVAQTLGLTIPPSLLVQADDLIE